MEKSRFNRLAFLLPIVSIFSFLNVFATESPFATILQTFSGFGISDAVANYPYEVDALLLIILLTCVGYLSMKKTNTMNPKLGGLVGFIIAIISIFGLRQMHFSFVESLGKWFVVTLLLLLLIYVAKLINSSFGFKNKGLFSLVAFLVIWEILRFGFPQVFEFLKSFGLVYSLLQLVYMVALIVSIGGLFVWLFGAAGQGFAAARNSFTNNWRGSWRGNNGGKTKTTSTGNTGNQTQNGGGNGPQGGGNQPGGNQQQLAQLVHYIGQFNQVVNNLKAQVTNLIGLYNHDNNGATNLTTFSAYLGTIQTNSGLYNQLNASLSQIITQITNLSNSASQYQTQIQTSPSITHLDPTNRTLFQQLNNQYTGLINQITLLTQ